MDKSFLFLILGLGCFWLVLDQVYGNKFINQAVKNVMDSITD